MICLDLHDFSIAHPRLDVLFKLKEHFPKFKVSLFTIPIDEKKDWGPSLIRDENLKLIKTLDWIQIIPHGYTHNSNKEMMLNYEQFKNLLPKIEEVFKQDGLLYEKGFCAPHWRWTEGVVQVLDELGWWGAIDQRQNKPCPKRFYAYSHKLDEPFWEAIGDLKLHGHIYGTKNDIGLCFNNLLRLHRDTDWRFATDFLEIK